MVTAGPKQHSSRSGSVVVEGPKFCRGAELPEAGLPRVASPWILFGFQSQLSLCHKIKRTLLQSLTLHLCLPCFTPLVSILGVLRRGVHVKDDQVQNRKEGLRAECVRCILCKSRRGTVF